MRSNPLGLGAVLWQNALSSIEWFVFLQPRSTRFDANGEHPGRTACFRGNNGRCWSTGLSEWSDNINTAPGRPAVKQSTDGPPDVWSVYLASSSGRRNPLPSFPRSPRVGNRCLKLLIWFSFSIYGWQPGCATHRARRKPENRKNGRVPAGRKWAILDWRNGAGRFRLRSTINWSNLGGSTDAPGLSKLRHLCVAITIIWFVWGSSKKNMLFLHT